MTPLRQKMIEDMQLRGLSKRTQESYVGAAKQLAEYYRKTPAKISKAELRGYFLYLQNAKESKPSTLRVHLYGLKFLYEKTLEQQWPLEGVVKPAVEKKMPVVLSQAEVRQVLRQVRCQRYQVCLVTIYSCGLRLLEGVRLRVDEIDSGQMKLHLRGGKGNKERYVPLPEETLQKLRSYWVSHHNKEWLFPGQQAHTRGRPMNESGVRRALQGAVKECGIEKRVTVHTLRHSYATHLLEAGVNIRQIQSYLGHACVTTTAIYTHLTKQGQSQATKIINQLMADLP